MAHADSSDMNFGSFDPSTEKVTAPQEFDYDPAYFTGSFYTVEKGRLPASVKEQKMTDAESSYFTGASPAK